MTAGSGRLTFLLNESALGELNDGMGDKEILREFKTEAGSYIDDVLRLQRIPACVCPACKEPSIG
jgi:hypothetical protein